MKREMILRADRAVPTRYSLLSRLHSWDDQESWREFFELYWRLIYSVAVRSGLTDAEAQDVVQETVMSVARHIHKFERDRARGSFKGWLGNIIRWRVADQIKKRSPDWEKPPRIHEDDERDRDEDDIPDPGGANLDAQWEEEWRTNLFEAAVDRVKQRVRGEHFQIFDLYVIRSWPVLKVARTLNVSVGRIYLVKHRISSLVKKEIRALEKKLS